MPGVSETDVNGAVKETVYKKLNVLSKKDTDNDKLTIGSFSISSI